MSEASAGITDQVIFQRFTEDDLLRLYRLCQETPEIARQPGENTIEALREQLNWPGHQPTRDRWIAIERADPLRLVGYSAVFKSPHTPRADTVIMVHPDLRRKGLGAELLRRALADATALGATDAAIYVNEQDAEAATFLVRRGFTVVGAYTELTAVGESRFPRAQWPAGYMIRAWRDESDLPLLVEAANRGFEGQWGHNHATAEEWTQWLPTLDLRGVCFLFDADHAIAGMVRSETRPTGARLLGVVDAPGVVPALRGAGLYRPLLLHALAWLAPQNPDEYKIESWGDDPAVLDAYRALGFETSRHEELYRYPLTSELSPDADTRT